MAREKIGEGYVEARLDGSRLRQDTSEVERGIGQSMQRIGRNMQESGAAMTRRFTVPIAAAGTAIVKVAGDFESSMNMVRAVTNATGDEFDQLRGLAMELGRTTQFSASEAADAMYFLASAGFDTNQVMEALPGTLQLAAAAQMDLATAADIASNVLQGYGMEVEDLSRVNDVLVRTFQLTNTNLAQLGEAMKHAAPVASAAGISFEEAAAAIGLMGNAGIQGSMAGTSLRSALSRLLEPTAQVRARLDELGVSVLDSEGNLRSLEDIIRQLETSGAGAGDMMTIFGQRAGPAMAALVEQGADALADLVAELDESGGTAERVANIQMEGLNGALARLKSAAEGVAIAIGDSGLLDDVAGMAEGVAGMFSSLAEANPEVLRMATFLAMVLAAIGPIKFAIGGLIGGIGKLLVAGLNPMNLAIAGAVTVIGIWAQSKKDAQRRVEEFKTTLDEATGAITDQTRELALHKLQQEGAVTAARELGISMGDLRDAALGVPGAMERVEAQLQAVKDRVGELGTESSITADEQVELLSAVNAVEGALGIVQGPLREATAETRELAVAAAEAENRFLDVQHAIDSGIDPALARLVVREEEHKRAAQEAKGPTDELKIALGLMGDEAEDTAEAIDDMTTAMQEYMAELRAISDPVFAASRAHEALERAQRDVGRAMEDRNVAQAELDRLIAEGADPDDIAAANRRLEDAHDAVADALDREFSAALDSKGALLELFGAIDDGVTSGEEFEALIDDLIESMGLSDEAADAARQKFLDMGEAMGALPEVEIEINTRQQEKLDDLIAHMDSELAVRRETELGMAVRHDEVAEAGNILRELTRARDAEILAQINERARRESGAILRQLAEPRDTAYHPFVNRRARQETGSILREMARSRDVNYLPKVDRRRANEAGSILAELSRDRTVNVNVRATGTSSVRQQIAAVTGGGLAEGGPFAPGVYLVGEEGPELVRFDRSGWVTPNDLTELALSGPALGALGTEASGRLMDTVGAAAGSSRTYSPTYVIHGEPSGDTLRRVRTAERRAYLEDR